MTPPTLEQSIANLDAAIKTRNAELVNGMVEVLDMGASHTTIIARFSTTYTRDFIKERLREAEALRDQRDELAG